LQIVPAGRPTPAPLGGLEPTELQLATEKRSQSFGFIFSTTTYPRRSLEKGFNDDLDAAALYFVTPNSLHEPVDEKNGRDPPLWPIHTTPRTANQQTLGVAGCSDHILIESWYEPHGSWRREFRRLSRISSEHPGLLAIYFNR